MDYNYYPQTGQKLFFQYINDGVLNKSETEKEVRLLLDGEEQTEKLRLNADGAFTYTAAKAEPLTVTPDNRSKSIGHRRCIGYAPYRSGYQELLR